MASIIQTVILLTAANHNMATTIILYVYFAIVTKIIELDCLTHQSPEITMTQCRHLIQAGGYTMYKVQ